MYNIVSCFIVKKIIMNLFYAVNCLKKLLLVFLLKYGAFVPDKLYLSKAMQYIEKNLKIDAKQEEADD